MVRYYKVLLSASDGISFFDVCSYKDYIIWMALLLMIILSMVIAVGLSKMKMNTRIVKQPVKNISWEAAGYVLPQAITIATIFFTDWWVVVSLAIFFVTGLFYVRSRQVHLSPLFIFPLMYKIIECDGVIIITNYSIDGFRLALEDDPIGVEGRELEKDIYLVLKR